MRRVLVAALALVLALVVGSARLGLERGGESRVPAGLLYLPRGPFLRALAVGQEETLADLLYIWSIQYYSNYDDKTRYDYLDAVFSGAITELDPHYGEAYIVGAMIMSVEARRPKLALTLLDKGIANNPENWEIAYWAGWEAYTAHDYARARGYFDRAAATPGAPVFLARMAARMLERQGDRRAAVAEYERLLASNPDERTKRVVTSWIERLLAEDALTTTRAALAAFRAKHGRCPAQLAALVDEGFLPRVPEGAGELRYDVEACDVLPAPGHSFGGAK